MDLNLSGKAAIVTGGSAGIGLACAKLLFQEGANVVIAARRNVEATAETIQKIRSKSMNRVLPCAIDLSKPKKAETVVYLTVANFETVDILINCAGSARAGAFLDLSDEDFIEAWTLKTLGYIRMVKAVLPHMMANGTGSIVNIIGAAGRTPSPTFLTGSTANAALINFTRGISKDLAGDNIRINAISPSATETERAHRLAEQTADDSGLSKEKVITDTISSIPIRRMIQPSEIAALAAFLASDLAAAITGAEILIDGGQTPGI